MVQRSSVLGIDQSGIHFIVCAHEGVARNFAESYRTDGYNISGVLLPAISPIIPAVSRALSDSATGIEISPDMVEIAQKYVKYASLQCRDITSDDAEIENKYDLITTYCLNCSSSLLLRHGPDKM